MESSDREILLRIEGRVIRLEGKVDGLSERVGTLEAKVGALEQGQRLLHVQIDSLQTSVYWVLAAIGIFLASLIIPSLRKKDGLSLQDVLALMNWWDKQKTGDADEPSEPPHQ